MYGFTIEWMTRAQLPSYPQHMAFSGVQTDVPSPGEASTLRTPVVRFGRQHLAVVLDDRHQHDVAWLVVFAGGVDLGGAHKLEGFRHIVDIQETDEGVTLRLIDASLRDTEISHQLLSTLADHAGRPGRIEQRQHLPVGIEFYLHDGHGYLVADGDGVHAVTQPEPLAARWTCQQSTLTHVQSRKQLGLGICCKAAADATDAWRLDDQGALLFGDGGHRLSVEPSTGEVSLRPLDAADAQSTWRVTFGDELVRDPSSTLIVDKLQLSVHVSGEYQAGTGDRVLFGINGSRYRQFLAENFVHGAVLQADVDLSKFFIHHDVFVDEIKSVELYQLSAGTYGPAWRMSALDLDVNGQMRNRLLASDSAWLYADPHKPCWQGAVNWLDWRRPGHDAPLDFAGYTYPVQWQQLVGDWLAWRSYDPHQIDGVCQLIGAQNGRIFAYDLKHRIPVYLKPNTENDSYTWVYTPQGSIILKHWDRRTPRDEYVRHSQLGAGSPVVCAGEMRISQQPGPLVVEDLLGMINDASGHYKPDGGACLGHVLQRLRQLGLDTRATQVHSTDRPR